jgi:hypothetical protein
LSERVDFSTMTEVAVELELLRSLDWIEDYGAHVGGSVFLDMPEMGVEGSAEVLSIEPCPPFEEGEGRLVTGTFKHTSGEIYDLRLQGESEPIGVTATHPFWSVDREAWVSAIDLEIGETLKTLAGTTVVQSRSKREEPETVYNIEVEGDHCYRVGESGVLVHNASLPGPAVSAGTDYGCGKPSGQGNCSRGDINSNITRPAGYEGHHLIGVAEASADIMERACELGYDINRGNNGIALPSYANNTFPNLPDGQAESTSTGLPLHRGPHRAANYNDCVRQHLAKLEADYRAGRVTDCNLCAKIKEIEDEVRRALLAHEIWLNRNDPHIQAGQSPSCTA